MHFFHDASHSPVPYLVGGVFVLTLIHFRGRIRPHVVSLNERVVHLHTDRFSYTLKTTLIVFAQAATWAAVLALLGWRLGVDSPGGSFSDAVARLFISIALALLPLSMMRGICADEGLAEVHFRWTRRTVRIVRRQLKLFTWVLVPVLCIGGQGPWVDEIFRASTGRVALIVLAAMLAFTMYRLIHPRKGAFAEKLRVNPQGLLNRTSWLCLPMAVLIPLALAVLAVLGYQFTAVQLMRNYYVSLWLITLAFLIHEFGVRWLALTAARLSWRTAVTARKAARAGDLHNEGADAEDPVVINVEAVNQQSLRLLSTVIVVLLAWQLWTIWSGLLPALGVLDEVHLWSYSEQTGGEQTVRYITLATLVLAVALAFLFAVAVPSVPRLLELLVYQRIEWVKIWN